MKEKRAAKTISLLLFCLLSLNPLRVHAQERFDPDIDAKIFKEATTNSQIMRTLHYLADVYGPRLTGSPNLKAADDWAIMEMKKWSLSNAHLEPWDFGHPGWINERAYGHIIAPVEDSLTFKVLAWTPSTNGVVTAQVYQMILPAKPTQEELGTYFDHIKDKIKGKIIFAGKPIVRPVNLTPPTTRFNDEELRPNFDPNAKPAPEASPVPTPTPKAGQLDARTANASIDKFLRDNDALVRVNDAGRPYGQIRAFDNETFDLAKAVPTIVLRNEDYGRISRLLADGLAVSLEIFIRNRVFPEGITAFNAIAEIPGTDKRDEVIILGAHLDSWHSATGATDNAIGCAMMMEALRILKAIGVHPRRTIRVALWSGEEEGLLGSQAYVKEHYGSFENPKPDYFKLDGYFNIDTGTGRARAMWVFGPPEAAIPLREAVGPFAYLGMAGANNFRGREPGSSDNTSFSQAGLPGIRLVQDPIDYGYTWHTNLDTYERVIEEDAKKSAIVIAATVYRLAMRDDSLPRFKREEMPPLPTPSP